MKHRSAFKQAALSFIAYCALAAGTASSSVAPAPSHKANSVMRSTVHAEHERTIDLLRRLVEQNSGTMNLEGVQRVGEIIRPELEQLGFTVQWEDMAAIGRAGHLIAKHRGARGRRVLLVAHMDTVFEPSANFSDFQRNGTRAVGPGIGDNKGGIVVIIAALRAMQAAGTLKDANITVYLTGDEERLGRPVAVARAGLIAASKEADAALEYEGLGSANGIDYATVARRSSSGWELRTTGKSAHASSIFGQETGFGAIYEMARILDGFATQLPTEDVRINVGVLGGGSSTEIDADGAKAIVAGKVNIVAQSGLARGDLRTLTSEQDADVRAAMQKIAAQNRPGTRASITFFDSYPAMVATPRNRALLVELNDVNRQLGLGEMPELPPSRRGAADSGFISAHVATLAGMGLDGDGSHAAGESADLDSIKRQALRSAVLISRLTQMPRD